ncbi:hypothetical protein CRC_03142 [Cylindrospermopsis raciborskii CS-505]|nr:hypothetical protein CRC_03142 [Cylindrospermopsis raciborskii CS-505]
METHLIHCFTMDSNSPASLWEVESMETVWEVIDD